MHSNVEHIFMQMIDDLRTRRHMTARTVAQSAFPDIKDADRRYRFLVAGSSPSGKPMRLSLAECVALARAVGSEPSHIIWEAIARHDAASAPRHLTESLAGPDRPRSSHDL